MSRALAQRALDALEDGDKRFAVELLLNIANGRPRRHPPRCPVCGQRAWPGDTRAHIASMHDPGDNDGLGRAA